MKAREKLNKIRQSKRFGERFFLAADRYPGTRFDREIRAATLFLPTSYEEPDERYRHFQEQMLSAIQKRDSQFFRDLADALDIHRHHKPQPDKMRQAILMCAANEGQPLSVEQIIKYFCDRKIQVTEETPRVIRRMLKELGIPLLKGKSGRPRKNRDTKAQKTTH